MGPMQREVCVCVCGKHDGQGIALGDQVGPAPQSMTLEPQFPHRGSEWSEAACCHSFPALTVCESAGL